MSKAALKHILNTDTVFNPIPNKYDFVSLTQLKTSSNTPNPEIVKFNRQKVKHVPNEVQQQKQEKSENNQNIMNSSSFKTQSTSANTNTTRTSTARILVKRHKPIELNSITKMSFIRADSQDAGDSSSTATRQQNGPLSSYGGSFFSNPLASNQNLADPCYYQNLLRSRTIYVLSPEESKKLDNVLKKTTELNKQEVKQQQQQNSEAETDIFEKPDYFCASTIVNEKISVTSNNLKSKIDSESPKKAIFSDIDSKGEVMAAKDTYSSSNNSNHATTVTNKQISKNMFLSYRPQTTATSTRHAKTVYNQNNSNDSSNSSSIIENNNKNSSNNQVAEANNKLNTSTTTTTQGNSAPPLPPQNPNNPKKLNRRNSILSNSQKLSKTSKASVEKESVASLNANILRHNPERYLDKFTILRIEKWIQDVNGSAPFSS